MGRGGVNVACRVANNVTLLLMTMLPSFYIPSYVTKAVSNVRVKGPHKYGLVRSNSYPHKSQRLIYATAFWVYESVQALLHTYLFNAREHAHLRLK